jgi:hypothetical protein
VRHIVFALPKRLRPSFQYDRKLLAIIASAAGVAISKLVTTSLGTDTVPAAVLALHTGSETLGWNPHAHLIVADGGCTKEDTFIRLAHWNQSELQKHFASHIRNAFVERELLDSTVATQILEQEHTGFAAWAERIVEPEDTEQGGEKSLFQQFFIGSRQPFTDSNSKFRFSVSFYLPF